MGEDCAGPETSLARHTTASLRALLDGKKPVVALIPVGSTEPHGPHLGLGTDVVISAAACVKACELFEKKGPLTAIAIALALVAIRLAARPPAGGFTFRFKRVAILSPQAHAITLLLLAAFFLIVNLIVDLLYAFLDPRIRY